MRKRIYTVCESKRVEYIYRGNVYNSKDYFDTEDEALAYAKQEHLRKYDIQIADEDVILYYNV